MGQTSSMPDSLAGAVYEEEDVGRSRAGAVYEEEEIFVFGDIHGDPLALMKGLQMTDAIDDIDWLTCANTLANTTNFGDVEDPFKNVRWSVKKRATLLFLGDIVDSKRAGRMVPAGGEEMVTRALVRLNILSRDCDSRVVWILGNHDIANLINQREILCSEYARPTNCQQPDDKFTQKRVDWLMGVYMEMKPNVIQVIDDMLFSHGTVTNTFLKKYHKKLTGKELVDAINEDYRVSIIQQKRTKRIQLPYPSGPEDPIDWSRHGTNPGEHSDDVAMQRLKTICAFSGHTKLKSISQVNHKGVRGNVSETFRDIRPYTQYLVDLGMSRVFKSDGVQSLYGCLQLMKRNTGKWQVRALYSTGDKSNSPLYDREQVSVNRHVAPRRNRRG